MKSESKFRLKFYIPLNVIIVAILAGIFFWYNDYLLAFQNSACRKVAKKCFSLCALAF